MKTLLYLVYGSNRTYHLELTYSILSAHRFLSADPQGVEIVLVSDAANTRPDLPVTSIVVPDTQLREWQLDGTYHYAAKIAALRHVLQLRDRPCALIDTDTIFMAHPARLFDRIGPGQSLMHANEGPLTGLREWPAYESAIEAAGGTIDGLKFTSETMMYNAGVCGAHPSDSALMEQISNVLEGLRSVTDVFTAEQLASSLVFSENTAVNTCTDIVTHYWDGPRAYYLYQMARLWPEIGRGEGLRDPNATFPVLHDRPTAALPDRLRARALQWRRGNDRAYAHAYLCAISAQRIADTDPELGSIWAEMAHDMLCYGMTRHRHETQVDFKVFSPASLAGLNWMMPKVQAKWRSYWEDVPPQ